MGAGGAGAGRTLAKIMIITRRIIAPMKNPPRAAFHADGGAVAIIYYNKTKSSKGAAARSAK
jgi:hypothetical protein